MVVHVMQPAIRAYYRLEEIWGDKPVKLGAAKRTSKKSASPVAEDSEEKPKRSRKTSSKAAPIEVTPDMMAVQTTIDEALPTKATRKPRTSKTADGEAKPARKPAVRKTAASTGTAKIPTGARVKVAASKTSTAKRPARKKAAE